MKKILLAFGFILALGAGSPALASIQQVRILAVGVDHSSEAANAKALDYAKKRAVYLIAIKLEIPNATARVAALKDSDFDEIVRGATVINSRREDDTTYLEVRVSVIDTVLKRRLGFSQEADNGQVGMPAVTRSVLILPVDLKDAHAYLWEDKNALREPLRSEVLRQAHGAVLLPAGDFDDLRLVDYQNVLTVSASELKPMFARYGADEIIVAIVALGTSGTAEPTKISLRRLTLENTRDEVMNVVPPSPDEKEDARLQAAASAIASAATQIATATSADEQRKIAEASKIPVHFAYASPRELAEMEESIRSAPGVISLEIPSISLQDVQGTVYFTGKGDALHAALSKKGIIVTERKDGWTVSLR